MVDLNPKQLINFGGMLPITGPLPSALEKLCPLEPSIWCPAMIHGAD
jgi:hypothetical protein